MTSHVDCHTLANPVNYTNLTSLVDYPQNGWPYGPPHMVNCKDSAHGSVQLVKPMKGLPVLCCREADSEKRSSSSPILTELRKISATKKILAKISYGYKIMKTP